MSELLKPLQQSNSTAAGETVPAKNAKPSPHDTMSESDDSDSEELLTDEADSGRKTDITKARIFTPRSSSVARRDRKHGRSCSRKTVWHCQQMLATLKLSDEKLKEKLEKFPWPDNYDKLIVPTVNPKSWGKLSRQANGCGLQFPRLQPNLVGHIVVKSTDLLLKANADSSKSYINDLVRMNTDAIYCLAWARQFGAFIMLSRQNQAKPPQRLCRPLFIHYACDYFPFWGWIASSTEPH